MVELVFLPSACTECPDGHGTQYKASTLEVSWRRGSASSWPPSCNGCSVGARCYVLDQPTSGLHCADTNRLDVHLQTLVEAGHTVVEAELDIRVIAVANQVIDLGPGAGDAGGTMVATGTAEHVADKGVAVRCEHHTATHSTNSWS